MSVQHSIVQLYHSVFIHFPLGQHLGLQILAVTTTMLRTLLYMCECFSRAYDWRGIAG